MPNIPEQTTRGHSPVWIDNFLGINDKENDMASNADSILGRFSTDTAGGEEKNPHTILLEVEREKATLAQELLNVAVPFVTIDSATLKTHDLIDVFVDLVERLRSTLDKPTSFLYSEEDAEDAYPPF